MRSTIKIILGASIILCILFALLGFVGSITILIFPGLINKALPNSNYTDGQIRISCLIFLIFVAIAILSAIASQHAIIKMDNVNTKKDLIPSIILLFLTLNFISALFLIFTPTKKIVSTHPYFE